MRSLSAAILLLAFLLLLPQTSAFLHYQYSSSSSSSSINDLLKLPSSSQNKHHYDWITRRANVQDENEGDVTVSSTTIQETEENEMELISEEPIVSQTQSPPPPLNSPPQQQTMSTTQIMQALGTNPRRILLGTSTAAGIALAGNFLGVTSNLLTQFPEESVEATGLDTYFPRGSFKRIRNNDYTFVIPREWVADTFVELAKAQRQARSLDLKMSRRESSSSSINTLPDAAFGPPGRLNSKGVSEQGDTNVSVIVSGGLSGFSLGKTLGPATEAAEKLLSRSIAPPGSGRTATLVDVFEDTTRQGPSIYQFEYILDRGERGPPLRNISVIGGSSAGDKFVTMTVVAPLETWKDPAMSEKLRKIATSFHLRG